MKFLAQSFFRITMLPVARLIYRVRRVGLENIPEYGGVLLLSNHISYIDSFIMYLACPRPVRFVVLEHYVHIKSIGWFLKLFGAIPIRPKKAKEAIERTVAALNEGDVVCLFPEGELSRTGVPGELKRGFELIVRKAECPVVPVFMDGLWRSIFSFERDQYIKKWPRSLTCPLQVAFGKAIAPKEVNANVLREKLWLTSNEAFSARRELDKPLEVETVRALKRNRRSSFLVEQGKSGPRDWTRAQTLGLAMAMARKWMAEPPVGGDRVGILLPPGPAPAVIGLGLYLAGKTPVYLPFTVEQSEMEKVAQSVAPLGIETVISSKAFMPLFMDYWPGDEVTFMDLKAVLAAPGSGILSMERIRAMFEPAWIANWRLDLNKRDPNREAIGMVPFPGDDAIFLSSQNSIRTPGKLHRSISCKRTRQFFPRFL